MNREDFLAQVSRHAQAVFAPLNCDFTIRKASSNFTEFRAAPRAFHYFAVYQVEDSRMTRDELENVLGAIDGMRSQMIENAFIEGYRPREGYPKGIMDPDAKIGRSF